MQLLIEKSEINYHLPINPDARETLNRLCRLIVAECIQAVNDADERHGLTTFDRGQIAATKERCVKSIKERLNV